MNAPRKLRTCWSTTKRCRAAASSCACAWRTTSRSSASAATAARRCSHPRAAPDLVFLDIQMPGLSASTCWPELQPHELPMIVFVTGVRPVRGAGFRGARHRLRAQPVDDARLAATLTHVRELVEQRTAVERAQPAREPAAELRGSGEIEAGEATMQSNVTSWLPIRNGRETVRVPVEAIEWVDAAGDYLCIHASGHTHILRATMREMENLLDPRLFQRVHRRPS
jgi:two-component system LytT family response regulator